MIGCISGLSLSGRATINVIAVSNVIMSIIGFTISGLRAPEGNRWPHLALVAVGAWLSGLINLLFGISLLTWACGSIFVAITMGIGGAISIGIGRLSKDSTDRI